LRSKELDDRSCFKIEGRREQDFDEGSGEFPHVLYYKELKFDAFEKNTIGVYLGANILGFAKERFIGLERLLM